VERHLGQECARLALDRKASAVRLLFVGDTLGIADYFVLATVHNRRQARAIRDAIRLALKAEGVGVPLHASEDPDGRWSLYDYGGVVVHLFDEEGRRYFDLDRRWKDAPELGLEDEGGNGRGG
jgi:ribosome-associated protein